MARPLRLCFAGACYHVMARGNAKALLFLDAEDYRKFLEILEKAAGRFSLAIYAYCQMPNHYHLVCRTQEANLSQAIGYLNSVYAQWWNARHGRCGHVTQGRFKAQLVQSGLYLCVVCRYVLNNPVRAGFVHHPEDWPWSSYRATVTPEAAPACLDTSLVAPMLGNRDVPAGPIDRLAAQFRQAVGQAIRRDDRIVGDGPFRRLHRMILPGRRPVGIPRHEWRGIRPTLSELFAFTGSRGQRERQIVEACRTWGFTYAEVAEFLGADEDAVGRTCRRVRRESEAHATRGVAPKTAKVPGSWT